MAYPNHPCWSRQRGVCGVALNLTRPHHLQAQHICLSHSYNLSVHYGLLKASAAAGVRRPQSVVVPLISVRDAKLYSCRMLLHKLLEGLSNNAQLSSAEVRGTCVKYPASQLIHK